MILIGVGTNLGYREKNLLDAIRLIMEFSTIHRCSKVVETDALLPENAPQDWDMPYLNQVISISYNNTALTLLSDLQSVEKKLGRGPHARWSPRVIDLDILWFMGQVIDYPQLKVPHPQIMKRPFVYEPIKELAPEIYLQLALQEEASLT